MKQYKNILFSAVTIIIFFGMLEALSRAFVFPGSYDYIERRILEQKLAQHKRPGEFRIFLYGESTMHGGALYPYSMIEKWLRLYLTDLLGEEAARNVTIVNLGRMGADSTFIAKAFSETIAYKPDVAVFYTVHNDFCLTEYRPALRSKTLHSHRWKDFFAEFPRKSAFLNLINRASIQRKIARSKAKDARLKAEDPWYSESDEPEAFRQDVNLLPPGSADFKELAERFEKNVKRIIDTARRRNVELIFFEGLSRWKDFEPIRSVHDRSLSPDALAAWQRTFSEAEGLFSQGKHEDALVLYRACINSDRSYALAYYRAAECYEHLGQFSEANKLYALANDNDHFPIRAPSFVNRMYEKIRLAHMKGLDVIQTQELIEQHSPNGIVDGSITMDQIHPSPEGQALMALEIARIIYERGLLAPKDAWRWEKVRSIDTMEKTFGLNSETMFYIYTGTASYLGKHYQEASRSLEKALAIRPRSVFVRSWLAWAYWKTGEEERALGLYRELYREKPELAAAFFKRHPDIGAMIEAGAKAGD